MRSFVLLLTILLGNLLQTSAQFDCGKNTKNTNALLRIIGGQEADNKQWPWMVALLRGNKPLPFCGGSLLTQRHVLTAAHCVQSRRFNDIQVRLGEHDFDSIDDNNPTNFKVQEVHRHESYNTETFENDIAILMLDRLATFGEFISPVCLPPPDNSFEEKLGYVTGWGSNKFGGAGNSILHEVLIKVWKRESCISAYTGSLVANSMMCCGFTTGEGDSCQGDSGGPFMVQIPPENRWHVAGIVSWGKVCGDPKHPGVYTRVNHYLDWISSKIKVETPVVFQQRVEQIQVQVLPEKPTTNRPLDCSEVCSNGGGFCGSGIYQIYPNGPQPVNVFCDMSTTVGGWTVLLTKLRTTPVSYFYKSFPEYKKGFGNADSEHWIGNENLHHLTQRRSYTLRIDSKTNNQPDGVVEFKKINLRSENANYKLVLDMLTVGDQVISSGSDDGLALNDATGNDNSGSNQQVYADYLQMKIRPN